MQLLWLLLNPIKTILHHNYCIFKVRLISNCSLENLSFSLYHYVLLIQLFWINHVRLRMNQRFFRWLDSCSTRWSHQLWQVVIILQKGIDMLNWSHVVRHPFKHSGPNCPIWPHSLWSERPVTWQIFLSNERLWLKFSVRLCVIHFKVAKFIIYKSQ